MKSLLSNSLIKLNLIGYGEDKIDYTNAIEE